MASFSSLVRGGHAKSVNLGVSKPKPKAKPAVGYGGTSGKYEHTLGQLGPPTVADTKTVAQRGGGLGGPANYTPPPAPDTKTAAQRGGGLGGDSSYSPPPAPDTQSVAQRGGGLGGSRMKRTR